MTHGMKSCFLCIGSGRLGDHVIRISGPNKEVLAPIPCPLCDGTGWMIPPSDNIEFIYNA